jgi:hypothetical protein
MTDEGPSTAIPPAAAQQPTAGDSETPRKPILRRPRVWLAVMAYVVVFVVVYFLISGEMPVKEPEHPAKKDDTALTSPPAKAIFSACSPAVVQVVAEDRQDRTLGAVSGFLISEKGLIATNYHVIKKAHTAHVILADTTKLSVLGVAALDEEVNIAIIKVAGRISAEPLRFAGIDLPPVGSKLYALGNPLGFRNVISDGLVSGHREIDGLSVLETTAPIGQRSSGGPLLAADGRVVGITTFAFKGTQNCDIAVPASQIARLLLRCEGDGQLTQFPLAPEPVTEQKVAEPKMSANAREAKMVEQMKKKLVVGMTSREVVEALGAIAASDVQGWGERISPSVFVVRYFPFEGSRGPGRTGLLYRLNLRYVNDRLWDWYFHGN